MILSRRTLLTGLGASLGSFLAAPAIVRASSLMPIRGIVQPRRYVAPILIPADFSGTEVMQAIVVRIGAP